MHKSILFMALFISASTAAQAPYYDDLMILYADGNYSKLIKYSNTYCQSNKTKNHALPYMWLARGYYKKSISGENSEEQQQKNLQQAITALSNCLQLDSNKQLQNNYYDFFHDFKTTLSQKIINEIQSDEPNNFWFTEYYKISPNSVGVKYIEGYYEHLYKNETCGVLLWNEADSLFFMKQDYAGWQYEEVNLLCVGITLTVKYYLENNQLEKAKTLVLKMTPYLKEEIDFQLLSESVLNKKSQ